MKNRVIHTLCTGGAESLFGRGPGTRRNEFVKAIIDFTVAEKFSYSRFDPQLASQSPLQRWSREQ